MSRSTWVRDTLISRGFSAADADRAMAEVKAEARAEGLSESERAFLTFALTLAADVMASRGDEFTGEDEAALTSLRAMATATPAPAAVPVPDGDETESPVEFGVRAPYGDVLAPTLDRAEAEQYLAHVRAVWTTAALMQRTVHYGVWTEVTS